MGRAARLLIGTAVLLLASSSLASASPLAASHNVQIANFAFSPSAVIVNAGDTVVWTNADAAAHSAKSTTGAFDTGTITQGQSHILTFNTPGTFNYICGIHGASMSGMVIVNSVATPAPPTPAPTPPPTVAPTPRPTAPPTVAPTIAPTPTDAPTATPAPSPSPSAATTAPATATATTVAAVPSAPAPSAAPASTPNENAPGPLLVAIGAVVILGLVGTAVVLLRR